MPRYRYRAVSKEGATLTGELNVADETAAIEQIRALGALPAAIEPVSDGTLIRLLNTEILPRKVLGETDLIVFTRSLAKLISAGMPIERSLQILRDTGERRDLARIAKRLLATIREGRSLADALDVEAEAFPRIYRMTVRAGEAGAQLGPVLTRLADTVEASNKQRSEVRAALIYPAFLFVTAVIALLILLGFVVPSFEPLLEDAGVDPPTITKIVVAAGSFVEIAWPTLLVLALALPLAVLVLRRSERIRLWSDRLGFKLPIVGRLWRKRETGKFARLLSILLTSGVALPIALRLVRETLSNLVLVRDVDKAIAAVEEGLDLARPLASGGQFAPLAVQMIEVGQESGRLAEMLYEAAEILEAEAKRDLATALSFLTPTITLVMGAMVALIVSSILFMLLSLNELAL